MRSSWTTFSTVADVNMEILGAVSGTGFFQPPWLEYWSFKLNVQAQNYSFPYSNLIMYIGSRKLLYSFPYVFFCFVSSVSMLLARSYQFGVNIYRRSNHI